MFYVTILNSRDVQEYYMGETSAESIDFACVNHEDLDTLIRLTMRHNYTLIINKIEEK